MRRGRFGGIYVRIFSYGGLCAARRSRFPAPEKKGLANEGFTQAKLYVRALPLTLTKRRFKYVNTEVPPGKSLSTNPEKSSKYRDIRGRTSSHTIHALQ